MQRLGNITESSHSDTSFVYILLLTLAKNIFNISLLERHVDKIAVHFGCIIINTNHRGEI